MIVFEKNYKSYLEINNDYEEICPICMGKSIDYNCLHSGEFLVCCLCKNTGKIDWIDKIKKGIKK